MRYIMLPILLLALVTSGCGKKRNPNCSGCGTPYTVPGKVRVYVRDSVSIDSVFGLFDSSKLDIEKMQGYEYWAALSSDSITVLGNYMALKPYIDSVGKTYFTNGGMRTRVTCDFRDMTLSNQQDWMALKNSFRLTDSWNGVKTIQVKVPEGLESFWAAKLETYPIVGQAMPIVLAP